MRLIDIFEEKLDEVSMSPGALADFAKTEFAQSMTAGFEAELVIPNVELDEEFESEPDYDQDERIWSIQDIKDFFIGDYNSRRTVERAIDEMNESFFEDADERFDEEMQDDIIEHARNAAKDDGMSEEEIDELFSEADSRAYEKYMDDARDEFRGDFYDTYFETWIRQNYPNASDFSQAFNLDWPHWTEGYTGEPSEQAITDVANSIEQEIGMEVKASSGYHGAKRGTGYFILEPDSSIDADESIGEAGLELVSPPMPLNQCLEYLDKVFAWANDNDCKTNRSTGFHMGISIPGQTMDNVDHLKFTLFLGDEYVLKQFGRESNSYAKSMMKQMSQRLKSQSGSNPGEINPEAMLKVFKQELNGTAAKMIKSSLTKTNDRYVTVNIKEKYIEVRSAGGNYLGDLDKIKNTLLRYVRAMALAADPEAEKQEYAKKLYKFLNPMIQGEEDIIKYFTQYSAGTLPSTALKSFIRQAQQTRSAKKIPDVITINEPKRGMYAFLITYLVQGGIKKTLRVYATGRSDATSKAELHLGPNTPIVNVMADVNDPTNQTNITARPGEPRAAFTQPTPATSQTTATAGTYIIAYLDTTGAQHQTAYDANSAREAEELFRSSHPSSYQIVNTTIA
jgi:Putative amidoligase enzyme